MASGTDAYRIEAVCKYYFAPAMAQHGLLPLVWATHGGTGLRKEWQTAFENVRERLAPQSYLNLQKYVPVNQMPKGDNFEYIILKDADTSYRTAPIAYGTQQNWDSTDVSERLAFSPKRLAERPTIMGEDIEEMDSPLIKGDPFLRQVGQKVIKLVNGMAHQLVNGAGSGQDLTGILGLCPVSSTTNLNGFGQSTAPTGFSGHTIGGLSVTASTNPELLPKLYGAAITAALTTPENLLKYIRWAILYASKPTFKGAVGVCAENEFVTLQGVLSNANQQLPGVVYSKATDPKVNYIVGGNSILINGVVLAADEFVPANHIIYLNLLTTGIRYKGKNLFQYTRKVDLAEIGYEIGTKGQAIEAHPQIVTCMPTNIAVISAWDVT